jgi:hypothetical protein
VENLSVGVTIVHYDGCTKVYVVGRKSFQLTKTKLDML